MKIILLTILAFAFQVSLSAQTNVEREIKKHSCSCENEKAVREYFEQYENQQKFIVECKRKREEKRKSLNLSKPIRISHLNPIAVSLVQPYYSKLAEQLRVSGEVLVEVFTDEKGFAIYSKTLKGNSFLRESVRKAACNSKFTPTLYCGKPIEARYLIKYNFISK